MKLLHGKGESLEELEVAFEHCINASFVDE